MQYDPVGVPTPADSGGRRHHSHFGEVWHICPDQGRGNSEAIAWEVDQMNWSIVPGWMSFVGTLHGRSRITFAVTPQRDDQVTTRPRPVIGGRSSAVTMPGSAAMTAGMALTRRMAVALRPAVLWSPSVPISWRSRV